MFDDVDEALRRLLLRELPVRSNEIDIAFHQPKPDWSSRLNRPTVNLFLYNVRENNRLRQAQPYWQVEDNQNGTATRRRSAVRVDLDYMVTAWASEPDDEHRLLGRTLMVFFRTPYLPEAVLPEGLYDQPSPISLIAARYEFMERPSDLWNSLGNQWRPAIFVQVTVAVQPDTPIVEPVVRTRDVRVGQRNPDGSTSLNERAGSDYFAMIAGRVQSERPLEDGSVTLVERGITVALEADGKFSFNNLKPGPYTLEIAGANRPASRHPIVVPSDDYTIRL